MTQLDALRAFALLAVIFHHLVPWLAKWMPLGGWSAVRFFFVLSGFLITSILLRARDAVDLGQKSAGATLRRFYFRRMLRIVPVYYGVLIGLAIFNAGEVRATLPWHLLFLSNVKFVIDGYHHAWIAHFWFLAAQEQFYFVWPFVVMLIPRRWLLPTILLTIAVGPAYRWSALHWSFSGVACEALPPACMDTLGFGALLAYLSHGRGTDRFRTAGWAIVGWIACLIVIGMGQAPISRLIGGGLCFQTRDLFMGVFGLVVLSYAAVGFRGWAGRVLTWKPLLYLGTISYGGYAYHMIVSGITTHAVRAGWIPDPPMLVMNALDIGLTIVVAALSWHLVEKPINSLKRKS